MVSDDPLFAEEDKKITFLTVSKESVPQMLENAHIVISGIVFIFLFFYFFLKYIFFIIILMVLV